MHSYKVPLLCNDMILLILYVKLIDASVLYHMNLTIVDLTGVNIPHNTTKARFDFNEIVLIPSNCFLNLSSLAELRFVHNKIQQVDDFAFFHVNSLKYLNLSFNDLQGVTENMLQGLVNLKELHLDNNVIFDIFPGGFCHVDNLEVLGLDHNWIDAILPGIFDCLVALKILFLHDNFIQSIGDFSFVSLGQLIVLTLDRNDLDVITTNSLGGKKANPDLNNLMMTIHGL